MVFCQHPKDGIPQLSSNCLFFVCFIHLLPQAGVLAAMKLIRALALILNPTLSMTYQSDFSHGDMHTMAFLPAVNCVNFCNGYFHSHMVFCTYDIIHTSLLLLFTKFSVTSALCSALIG